ncbi:MAG: hypothetical protein DSZ28_06665, partial [Thiothrix sp.]
MNSWKPSLTTPLLLLVLCGEASAAAPAFASGPANAVIEKEIPSTSSMLYYSIGGGNLIPKPANFEVIKPYSVNFRA